jgi:tRNA(Ile)-lysidine synthase
MGTRRHEPPDILRHAASWLAQFPADTPHLIGVSGGRDSVALLHALVARGYRRLAVCHLDHGLRPESAEDARFVAQLAADSCLDAVVERCDVRERAKRRHESLEAAGRHARTEFFARVAAERGVDAAFLAHHADDQVETFLFNLCRGAGSAGMAAMRPVTRFNALWIVRPLLGVWREEIDAYVKHHGITFREDASNADLAFTRNRLRHEAIPALSAALGRDVRRAIGRAAGLSH